MGKEITAVLFPGQGAYYGCALLDLQEGYPEVKSVFAEIDSAARPLVGDLAIDTLFPPRAQEIGHLLWDAPASLQLAIYAASVGVYTVLCKRGLRPDVLIGHSLGEITARVAAGAFTVAEGAQIVCHRSALMPNVPSSHFERFWSQRGGHVTAFARREYAAYEVPPRDSEADGTTLAVTSSPAPAAAGRDSILPQLTALYAEVLEYPAEVFAEDTELGVDSVNQTELLGRVGEQFGLPPRPSDFRPGPYSTFGKIADLVLSAA